MPSILNRPNAPRPNRLNADSHAAVARMARPPRQATYQLPQVLSQLGLWRPAVRAWVNENRQFEHDQRGQVYGRLNEFFRSAHQPDRLRLSGLDLVNLPRLFPPGIQRLDLGFNQLPSIPNNLPSGLIELNVRYNELSALPGGLPRDLRALDAGHNQLTALPSNLPRHLQSLDVRENRLVALPACLPRDLQSLNVSQNQLSVLPGSLPHGLENLNVAHNQLTAIPRSIPPGLLSLDLSYNQVQHISAMEVHRMAQQGRLAHIDLTGNPLSDQSIDYLRQVQSPPEYQGARITWDPSARRVQGDWQDDLQEHLQVPARLSWQVPFSPGLQVPALGASAAAWRQAPGDKAETARLWAGFSEEPGAASFSRFLDRLRETVNSSHPHFQASVTEWLKHLEGDADLRRETFLVSDGATASCQDRVSHSFNAMRQLRLSSDVGRGVYDQRLPELLTVARSMFRMGELETIAREHAASIPDVDEIEVYLAFQVQLRERLALPLDTPGMAYPSMAHVTPRDLSRAQARVMTAEQQNFSRYLSCDWQPWQSVLRRLVPEEYARAQERLFDAMDEEFSHRLNARLREHGLENDADAQRALGSEIQAELTHEIRGPVTRDLLESRGLPWR